MFSKLRSKGKSVILRKKETEEAIFLRNGGKLFEERIATCYGRENPIKIFSAVEIHKAKQDFKQQHSRPTYVCWDFGSYEWCKGILDDRLVLIEKVNDGANRNPELVYHDIAVSSMMSSHGNVLKLLGCCMELNIPALVYEDAGNGPLNSQGGIDGYETLPWKSRLRIARQVASAVAYMHTAFPRPIIHRDIKTTNILLDLHFVPKLTGFSLSISIPEGESQVKDDVMGTIGYLDPSYARTNFVTDKSDVYNFGMLLLVFLTGQRPIDRSRLESHWNLLNYVKEVVKQDGFYQVIDPAILKESAEGTESEVVQLQLQAFVQLALGCTRVTPEDRPPMIDVGKELLRIERSFIASGSTTQDLHFQIAKRWEELKTSLLEDESRIEDEGVSTGFESTNNGEVNQV